MVRRVLFANPVHRRMAPLFAAAFFGGLMLWIPVEKLFLAGIGFTPATIGLMAAIYAGVAPVLDFPTGILADRWSRRGVLVLANIAGFLAVLVGGLSTNVGTYLAAAVLLGAYLAMESGTLDAIVYDTVLEETGDSETFESIIGRVRMVESASLVVGALGGGILASVTSPRATYFATLPFLLVSTAFLFAFREPRLHERGESRSMRRQISLTIGVVRRERSLLPVAALLVLTAVLTQAVFEFGPLWLVDGGARAATFGPAWACLVAALGFGGAMAGRVRVDSLRAAVVFASVLLAAAAVLVLSSAAVAVTAAQTVLVTGSVVAGIALTKRLHDGVGSDVRTGVSSAVGAATWATFVPLALVFGAVIDGSGVHAAGWLIVAIVGVIAVLLVGVVRPTATTPCSEPATLRPALGA